MALGKGIWIAEICAWIRTHGIFNLYNLLFTHFYVMKYTHFHVYVSYISLTHFMCLLPRNSLSPASGTLRETRELWWWPSLEGSVELPDEWDWLAQEIFHEQLSYCSHPSVQFFFWGGWCPKGAANSKVEHEGAAFLAGTLNTRTLFFLTWHFSFTETIWSHCRSDDNFHTFISHVDRFFSSRFCQLSVPCPCWPLTQSQLLVKL